MKKEQNNVVIYTFKSLVCVPYQLCPKCEGKKKVMDPICSTPVPCDLCNEQGVIPMFIVDLDEKNVN